MSVLCLTHLHFFFFSISFWVALAVWKGRSVQPHEAVTFSSAVIEHVFLLLPVLVPNRGSLLPVSAMSYTVQDMSDCEGYSGKTDASERSTKLIRSRMKKAFVLKLNDIPESTVSATQKRERDKIR